MFSGFFGNFLFSFVLILTFGIQYGMVMVGGKAIKCYPLTLSQNKMCIGLASTELVWGLLLKFIPVRFFQWVTMDEEP